MQTPLLENKSLRIIAASALVTAIFAGMSIHAMAVSTSNEQPKISLTSDFRKMDLDRDGQLSKTEINQDKEIIGQFDSIDINNDGNLSVNEYHRYKSDLRLAELETYIDDSTITATIKAELIKEAGLKGLDISVETHKGNVILSGFVESPDQALRAVEIASGVTGALSIKNALVVKAKG